MDWSTEAFQEVRQRDLRSIPWIREGFSLRIDAMIRKAESDDDPVTPSFTIGGLKQLYVVLDELDRLNADKKDALSVLKELEYVPNDFGGSLAFCPICGYGPGTGHRQYCSLARLLSVK